MLDRCNNPNRDSYKWYGAKGIKVCERWMDFKNFYEDMHPRPDGTQLDRKDEDCDYSKENCKWSTPLENILNKNATVYVEFEGEKLSLREAERRSGVSARTIRRRLDKGIPPFS
jgi:hypothetical protein